MGEMEKKRIAWLDAVKAIGILVVLLVHTGRSFGAVSFYGGMFYMPVFFITAGMTFSYQPEQAFGDFLKKKAKRLLVPYFAYNLFLLAFFWLRGQADLHAALGILYSRNCLMSADSATNVYFMQILNAPTWFLTCMFVSYGLFWILMRVAGGDSRKAFVGNGVYLLIAIALHYLSPALLPWSIDCAFYAVSFLVLGKLAAVQDWVGKLLRKPWYLLLLAVAFVLTARLNGSVNMSVGDYGRSMALYLFVGTAGSLLVMALCSALYRTKHTAWLQKPLDFIGRHTLPILCLHLFVYSVIGTVLAMLGVAL